ncbi:hypothetical protein OBK20_12765 [Empedobacter falsenii]
MKNNDKLSSYIKNDLENREINPSHDAWNRIQARMDVAPTRQKSNFKWWLSVAAVAFFTISTSIYFFMNQSENNNEQQEFVHHKEQDNPTRTASDSNKINLSETVLADNDKVDSSKERIETPIKEENKAIQHGKVQVAVNEESQQVEILLPTKKEAIVEKKEELKADPEQKKIVVAATSSDSIKTNKKKKNFVDPNMLLYSIENKENLKEQNQSRVVSVGFK